MGVLLVLVLVLLLLVLVTGVKQSQLLVYRLSLEFDKNQTVLTTSRSLTFLENGSFER